MIFFTVLESGAFFVHGGVWLIAICIDIFFARSARFIFNSFYHLPESCIWVITKRHYFQCLVLVNWLLIGDSLRYKKWFDGKIVGTNNFVVTFLGIQKIR